MKRRLRGSERLSSAASSLSLSLSVGSRHRRVSSAPPARFGLRAGHARVKCRVNKGRKSRGFSRESENQQSTLNASGRACVRACVHTRARARVFAQRNHAGNSAVSRQTPRIADSPTGCMLRERTCECMRPHTRNMLGRLGLFTTALYLFPWSAILLLFVPREPRMRTNAACLCKARPYRAIEDSSISFVKL